MRANPCPLRKVIRCETMKEGLDIDIRAEVRAIDKAMASMLAKARAAGVVRASIFFESEGSGYVMDDDHEGQVKSDTIGGAGRQKAIVAQGHLNVRHDVGAW